MMQCVCDGEPVGLYETYDNGRILQATHTHDAIAEAAQLMKEAVDDIMVTLNEAASEGGMVGGMVESIAEAIGRVSGFIQLHPK